MYKIIPFLILIISFGKPGITQPFPDIIINQQSDTIWCQITWVNDYSIFYKSPEYKEEPNRISQDSVLHFNWISKTIDFKKNRDTLKSKQRQFEGLNQLEIIVGYGSTLIIGEAFGYFIKPISPFHQFHQSQFEYGSYFRFGINYYHTFKEFPSLLFNTGISYDRRKARENSRKARKVKINHLNFPLGMKIMLLPENKFRFTFGSGLNGRLLMLANGISNKSNKYSFQLRAKWDVGFIYQIIDRVGISLYYQNNFDLTNMYEKKLISPGGAVYYSGVEGFDGFIKLGILYNL